MDSRTDDELTVRQAARRVGRADETVRRWIWSGRLPARKLGNQYVVHAADLDAVSAGRQLPRPREEPPLTMSEWLDEVARSEDVADVVDISGSSMVELIHEDREARAEQILSTLKR